MSRTRTLIQVGGLADKAGIYKAIGLEPGLDLQLGGPKAAELAAILLGAFLTIADQLKGPGGAQLREGFRSRGVVAFREESSPKGK